MDTGGSPPPPPSGDGSTGAGPVDLGPHSEREPQLVDLLPLAVVCLDSDGAAVLVNAAWAALDGRPASAHLDAGWLDVFRPGERDAIARWVRTGLTAERPAARNVVIDTPTGRRLLRLDARPHHDRDGRLRSYLLSGTDVTEQVAREERLIHAASHDPLTGLANRGELFRRTAMLSCEMSRAGGVGLMFLDLDDFKAVNDRAGHTVGDAVLSVVADRLRGAVRPFDVVARYGGDEFAVLLVDVADAAKARAIAERVLERLSQPIEVRGTYWTVGASAGIALTDNDQFSDLLERADACLYAAKAQGKGVIVIADEVVPVRQPPQMVADGMPDDAAHPLPTAARSQHGAANHGFHAVHFYVDDDDLLPAVAGYVSAGLFEDCVTVIATPAHLQALNTRLDDAWVRSARREHRYLELDAAHTLTCIMRAGLPDPHLFDIVLGGAIRKILSDHPRARGYGEMVGLLVDNGEIAAALALEDLWNELQLTHHFPVLCAYRRQAFAAGPSAGYDKVCARHTQLLMAG